METIRDWLRYATSLFTHQKLAFGQSTLNAYDEATWLLRHALHLPTENFETFLDARLSPTEKTTLKSILHRRAFLREPAAYIIGEAWLGDFSFRVDPRVVIPRSYFLEIISDQLNQWIPNPDTITRIADVCTGSGCLAILLAAAYPNAHIDATDISQDALDVATLNIADYNLQSRITPRHADILNDLRPHPSPPATPYDIILCNPPYEPESLLETLPEEFHHEPTQALISGPDGMDIIRRLLPQATSRLAPNGILLVETGALHDTLETEFPTLEFHWLPTQDESDCVALLHASSLRTLFHP
jgi:ribosomal protein L3 glutamine methyltransferase